MRHILKSTENMSMGVIFKHFGACYVRCPSYVNYYFPHPSMDRRGRELDNLTLPPLMGVNRSAVALLRLYLL